MLFPHVEARVTKKKDKAPDEYALMRVARYREMLAGWMTTQIEPDKQAMGLSGLAIGLLVAFRQEINTGAEFVLWIVAGLCFFSALMAGMRVMYLNARYLEKELADDSETDKTKALIGLSRMTAMIYGFFLIGATFTAILAVSTSPYLDNSGGCK